MTDQSTPRNYASAEMEEIAAMLEEAEDHNAACQVRLSIESVAEAHPEGRQMVPIPADTPALPERHRAVREKAIAKLPGDPGEADRRARLRSGGEDPRRNPGHEVLSPALRAAHLAQIRHLAYFPTADPRAAEQSGARGRVPRVGRQVKRNASSPGSAGETLKHGRRKICRA